jgi:hypothetical protein
MLVSYHITTNDLNLNRRENLKFRIWQNIVHGAYTKILRPWRKWEDNAILDLRKTGREVVDWMHLDRDRDQRRALVNTVMNLPVL